MKINGKEPELLEPIPYGIIGVKKKKSLDCLKKKKGIKGSGGSPQV